MPGIVPDPKPPSARAVTVAGREWRREGVLAVYSRRLRRRGLRPRACGRAILMCGSSVHGFGMRESLGVAAIRGDGRVVSVAVLRPGRVLSFPGSTWILELPPGEPLPAPGVQLELLGSP